MFITLCSLGALNLRIQQEKLEYQNINSFYQPKMVWTGKVISVYPKETYTRNIVRLLAVKTADSVVSSDASIVLYNYTPLNLRKGNIIQSQLTLRPIKNKGFPGEFDMARFYAKQGITHQIFIHDSKDIFISSIIYLNALERYIEQIRKTIRKQLTKMIQNPESLSIAIALLLGKDNNAIDENVMQSFITAGVVHVIVISGLHIGMIAWMVGLLLKPLRRNKNKILLILSAIINIGCIWFFCILAGMGISVIRAAIMFSLIQATIYFGQSRISPFQVLAISAIIILLINPYLLWSIGFIFSFSALLGIFLLSDTINRATNKTKGNAIYKGIFKLVLISLAANVFLIPISGYVFGKFYPYFILTNIIAVPLTGLILKVEILALISSFIPYLDYTLGKILSSLIFILRKVVKVVAQLPYATIDYPIASWQLLCFCGFLFFIIYATLYKSVKATYMMFSCLLLLVLFNLWLSLSLKQQQSLYVLNWSRNTSLVLLVNKYEGILLVKDSNIIQKRTFKYLINGLKNSLNLNNLHVKTINNNVNIQRYRVNKSNFLNVLKLVDLQKHQHLFESAEAIIIQPLHDPRFTQKIIEQWKHKTVVCSNCPPKKSTKNESSVHQLETEGTFVHHINK